MTFKQYNKDTDKWREVASSHAIVDVPNVFAQVLYNYRDKAKLDCVEQAIETGTFEGETTVIFSDLFQKVYTVEQFITGNSYTSRNLQDHYMQLKAAHSNINFYSGDSVEFLKKILEQNKDKQFVFLLDAHTPSHSPVVGELNAIATISNRKDHVIVVDDCVDLGRSGWPSKSEFDIAAKQINPNYSIEVSGLGRDITIIYEK
jgi:hypothetical protein